MGLQKSGRIVSTSLLFILEYGFKFLAGVGAAIVLAADGSFFGKLGAGLGSLFPALRQLLKVPENFRYIGTVIEDYNTMTAASFNQQYGGQAINHVLQELNEGVDYFQAVYQNLTTQPVATIFATVIAFSVLYLLGRASRFVRQKGQGSYIDRVERRLGDRVFRDTEKYSSMKEYS